MQSQPSSGAGQAPASAAYLWSASASSVNGDNPFLSMLQQQQVPPRNAGPAGMHSSWSTRAAQFAPQPMSGQTATPYGQLNTAPTAGLVQQQSGVVQQSQLFSGFKATVPPVVPQMSFGYANVQTPAASTAAQSCASAFQQSPNIVFDNNNNINIDNMKFGNLFGTNNQQKRGSAQASNGFSGSLKNVRGWVQKSTGKCDNSSAQPIPSGIPQAENFPYGSEWSDQPVASSDSLGPFASSVESVNTCSSYQPSPAPHANVAQNQPVFGKAASPGIPLFQPDAQMPHDNLILNMGVLPSVGSFDHAHQQLHQGNDFISDSGYAQSIPPFPGRSAAEAAAMRREVEEYLDEMNSGGYALSPAQHRTALPDARPLRERPEEGWGPEDFDVGESPSIFSSDGGDPSTPSSPAPERQQKPVIINLPVRPRQPALQPARPLVRAARASGERIDEDVNIVALKNAGWTYKSIINHLDLGCAVSTVRGRYRNATKPKEDRVRKPTWTDIDIALLHDAVTTIRPKTSRSRPWERVSAYIISHGGTYRFGAGTCAKKWKQIRPFYH